MRSGLPVAVVVVTFLEGLGEGAAGLAASQSGTMVHPIAKSNVAMQVRGRIQAGEEKRMRFCISGEVVAPTGGCEWRQH